MKDTFIILNIYQPLAGKNCLFWLPIALVTALREALLPKLTSKRCCQLWENMSPKASGCLAFLCVHLSSATGEKSAPFSKSATIIQNLDGCAFHLHLPVGNKSQHPNADLAQGRQTADRRHASHWGQMRTRWHPHPTHSTQVLFCFCVALVELVLNIFLFWFLLSCISGIFPCISRLAAKDLIRTNLGTM